VREAKICKAMEKILAKQKIENQALQKKLINQQNEQKRQRISETS